MVLGNLNCLVCCLPCKGVRDKKDIKGQEGHILFRLKYVNFVPVGVQWLKNGGIKFKNSKKVGPGYQ